MRAMVLSRSFSSSSWLRLRCCTAAAMLMLVLVNTPGTKNAPVAMTARV